MTADTQHRFILAGFVLCLAVVTYLAALAGTYTYHTFIAVPPACPNLEVMQRYFMYERLRDRIQAVNPRSVDAGTMADVILTAAINNGVKPYLLGAVYEQESRYNPEAVGLAGERGLAQITKRTAGVLKLPWDKATDPYLNADAGARYLAQHLREYGTVSKALARYNGGSTQYAVEVMARYAEISGGTL